MTVANWGMVIGLVVLALSVAPLEFDWLPDKFDRLLEFCGFGGIACFSFGLMFTIFPYAPPSSKLDTAWRQYQEAVIESEYERKLEALK